MHRLSKKTSNIHQILRRDGRVVDYSGLENRRAERHRGFESLSLRNKHENQCFTKQTPDFTPKNVKSSVFYLELPDFIFARIVVISTQPQGFPNNLLIP